MGIEQTSLLDAIEARDQAMAQVEEHAGPSFRQLAEAFVLGFLRSGPATSETISDACKLAGIVPHDDRAFGPVYMALSRAGHIRKAGHAVRRKGHGTSGGNVWALV